MAHSDDNVSHGGLLLQDRPSRRGGPNRPAPHTDRWWLVDAPPASRARGRGHRGPAHPPSRSDTHSDGLPLGHLFEPVTEPTGIVWPDRYLEREGTTPASAGRLGGLPQQTPHATPPHGWQPVPSAADLHPGQAHAHPGQAHARMTHGAALPRRRDVRAGRAAAPAPQPPVISAPTPGRGIALGAPLTPAGFGTDLGADVDTRLLSAVTGVAEPYSIDLSPNPLPRRRDLRRAEQESTSRRALREARKGQLTEAGRTGWSPRTTNVARGAVLTGLVAVGVVTVTGQHLDLVGTATPAGDLTAELALPAAAPRPTPTYEVYPVAGTTAWEAGADARAAIAAGLSDVRAKQLEKKKEAARRAAEKAAAEARAAAKAEALRNAQRNPRAIGKIMAAERGWTGSQWTCLNLLWNRESRWRWNADNPSSSAYGIPQALPGSRMASAGSDWRTNPVTQIEWGLDYIAGRYGTPCNAWAHSEKTGWY